MTLQELLEKWNKVTEVLIKDHHLKAEEIPTVSQLLDAAKKNEFFLGVDSAISVAVEYSSDRRNLIFQAMLEAGFLESNDEKGWKKLNKEWERDSRKLYNQDLSRRQDLKAESWAREKMPELDENGMQDYMAIYLGNPKYVHALRKVNAEREYYKNYRNLNKEQKKKINSNDISELIDAYHDEKNPELQEFINNRIERLMHMKKAFGEAAQKALDGNQKSPYGKLESEDRHGSTFKRWLPDMQNQHPGLQSTTQGCWSVTLSALLKHQGIEVSQNDLRQFKPETDQDFSNSDSGQSLGDYKPLINELSPNTMFLSAQQEIQIPVNGSPKEIEEARKEAKENLGKLFTDCLDMSGAPIGLLINGHYRILYGAEAGKDAETVYIHDPYSNTTSSIDWDTLIGNNLGQQGECTFTLNWIQKFDFDDNKKIGNIPSDLSKEIEKDKNPDGKTFMFETTNHFTVSADLPDKLYTKKELQELREEAANKWKESKALEEKLDRWDKNSKDSLSDYNKLEKNIEDEQKKDQSQKNENGKADLKGQIDELKTQVNKLSESISQHKALLDKITETLKDAPSEEELIQAKEIISPKKLDSLQTNSSKDCKQLKDIQNELNERKKTLTESFEEKNAALKTMEAEFNKQEEARRKELEDNQRARKEIFDTYNAIKDTRNYGRKSHEPFQRMLSALAEYRLTQNQDAAGLYTEQQKLDAAKALYDACNTYLEKHVVKDKSGKMKIGGQHYETGAIRKQAAVQILELLENLPEYKKAMQKQLENPVAEEAAEPKKGKEVKREKIDFNQLRGDLKSSLTKHTKNKRVAPGKDAAYADLDAAKAKLRK